MRELNENEVEIVSGGGDGEIIGVSVLSGISAGLSTFGAGMVLAGTGPLGWAVAAGIVVAGGTTALGVFVA